MIVIWPNKSMALYYYIILLEYYSCMTFKCTRKFCSKIVLNFLASSKNLPISKKNFSIFFLVEFHAYLHFSFFFRHFFVANFFQNFSFESFFFAQKFTQKFTHLNGTYNWQIAYIVKSRDIIIKRQAHIISIKKDFFLQNEKNYWKFLALNFVFFLNRTS